MDQPAPAMSAPMEIVSPKTAPRENRSRDRNGCSIQRQLAYAATPVATIASSRAEADGGSGLSSRRKAKIG